MLTVLIKIIEIKILDILITIMEEKESTMEKESNDLKNRNSNNDYNIMLAK